MTVVNTPAYFDTATITTVKSFIVQAQGEKFNQGTLTEGEGSVRLTSSLVQLVLEEQ